VMVSLAGFKTALQNNLVLQVGQELVANIQLNVGDVSEKVTVTEEPITVNTTSATLSNVVGGQTVRDLPINGRDWTLLAALEPGVHTIEAQSAISTSGNARANRGFGTAMTIAGNRPQQNNYRLDGISINDYSGSGPGNVIGSTLGVDAVQEFSVVTGNASADYGKTSGGVVNAVTRSGQNQFHGSAYEFFRNSALDARNFFNTVDAPQSPFHNNQFGGSLGGPLWKDKTFFFGAYEGQRESGAQPEQITVPSQAGIAASTAANLGVVDPVIQNLLNLNPWGFPYPAVGDLGGIEGATINTSVPFFNNANTYIAKIDQLRRQ